MRPPCPRGPHPVRTRFWTGLLAAALAAPAAVPFQGGPPPGDRRAAIRIPRLGAAAAQPETREGAALRARVTPAVLARWAPDVRFHVWEQHFPSSAEALFQGARAYRVGAREQPRAGSERVIQSPADLAKLGSDWRIRFAPDNPNVMRGQVAGERPNLSVTAPMYVSVQVPADASYLNLRYNFLFGYNGAQSMRAHDGTGSFNYSMRTLAEHEGDWEGVDIRLTPELDRVLLITTEAHGDRKDYLPGEMDWTDSTHAQLRLALNSHGVYNGKGKNPNDWIILEDLKAASVIDIITRDGPVWRPWILPDGLRVFGLHRNGRPLGQESWTSFRGRMGTHKTNAASGVVDVSGAPLAGRQAITANAQRLLFKAVSPFLKDLFNGMPCSGIGMRQELQCELPALRRLAGHRQYLIRPRLPGNLVLSLDQANPGGGLVLDTLRPGDPAERWYVLQNKQLINGRKQLVSVSLVNVASGALAGMRGGQGSLITQWHRSINDATTRWTLAGDRTSNCAIRPLRDSNQNLNVLGNGPYRPGSPVSTWSWSRGRGNETWIIQPE